MEVPSLSLKGKVAIVTGGKRGIGKAIALTLAKAGADVAICARAVGDRSLEKAAQEIRDLGRRSLAIRADVSKKSDVESMVQQVTSELGEIDVLVNDAGVMSWGKPLIEVSEEYWDNVIDINLKGYFLCSQAVAKRMMVRKKGSIVNIASACAWTPIPGSGIYCISKAGVMMLTRNLALELAGDNIRVNGIAPGWVKTEMNSIFRPSVEIEKQIARGVPLGRLAEPEDIARVALYLASDASEYVTGHTVCADGGMIDLVASQWCTTHPMAD